MQTTEDIASRIARELNLTQPLTVEFIKEMLPCVALFDQKQSDYGPKNISGGGEHGLVLRLNDKQERLMTAFWKHGKPILEPTVKNESIEDTLRDKANYSIIMLLWRSGKWPR